MLVLALLGAGLVVAAGFAVAAFAFGVLVLRDAGRRRRAQEAALEGERRYRALLDHLPVVAFSTRVSDLELLYASAQVERLLAVSREQALGESDVWSARLHPLDRERVLGAWESWLSGSHSEPFRSDYRMLGDDGRVVWVEDVTILNPGGDERPPTFQRHLLDVTRQRQLEEQLQQAQRLELLGRLAAGVAHDFNNLLAVIEGYSARITSDLPRSAREESSRAITAAAERGATLVRQLLAFSRPQPAQSRVVDLNELIKDFAPLLERVIGEDLEFELTLDPQLLPVEVEPVQIDQVLMNIAVNARDAMPDGGRLTITTAAVVPDGALLEEVGIPRAALITIADTGCGMDATTQRQIFEPFFSTKGPAKGSGLGLATAYGIVRQAGGSITVSSVQGQGTTFRIYLPLAAADVRVVGDSELTDAPPGGGRETVLVVEDEPALRELERLMLEEAGYEVFTAANASEALVVADECAIDVLLVDVVMPGMSGPQLADELTARGREVPTVFVSGYGSEEISSRGVSAGQSAVIEKPFPADLLLRRVREVLERAAPSPRTDPTLRLVRCLACDTLYGQAHRHDRATWNGCPRCGYVGWTGTG